ncbi:MAG: DUF305 domain-containing protein [Desulfomonilaceae bacterium]
MILNRAVLSPYVMLVFLVFSGSAQAAENGTRQMNKGAGERSFDALMSEAMMTMHESMKRNIMNGSPDHDFAAMMIPHHRGAIDMAEVFLRFGEDKKLRILAHRIIEQQRAEIGLMQTWLKQCKESPVNRSKAFTELLDKDNAAMHMGMEKAEKSGVSDHDFVTLMIPHHQGAIAMAKDFLKYGKASDLLRLARKITTSQEREITFMDKWLKYHGNGILKRQ